MRKKVIFEHKLAGRHGQQGMIASLLAIIVLVATLLAAVARMRSLDTSNTIAGSLAFRQGVIQESERAYTDVKNLMNFSEPSSDADGFIDGYHAELLTSTSPASKGLPDILVQQATSTAAIAGVHPMPALANTQNLVYYVLERLCPLAGPADPTKCSVPVATITGGSSSNQTTDKGAPFNSGSNASFRLSVLVIGQKNIVAYTQTILR
jgi:type IV pilus assembly protein PilX